MIAHPDASLEPLDADDVAGALAVHQRAFGYPYPSEALHRDVAAPDAAVLGARRDGALLGFGVVRLLADEAHVLTLAVLPAVRGRGVGRALLAAMREAAV